MKQRQSRGFPKPGLPPQSPREAEEGTHLSEQAAGPVTVITAREAAGTDGDMIGHRGSSPHGSQPLPTTARWARGILETELEIFFPQISHFFSPGVVLLLLGNHLFFFFFTKKMKAKVKSVLGFLYYAFFFCFSGLFFFFFFLITKI